jgi:dATP pyrophosphohydrolase
MARAPFNVLVYPCIKVGDNEFEYAILRRSDSPLWQGIAGGGEDDELPLDTAQREALEEAGIPLESPFIRLDTASSVPVTVFREDFHWGDNLYVIPQICFGVLVNNKNILLSAEHTEYKWLKYQDARNLLRFDGDRTALWELDRRLRGLGPRD